MSNSVLNIIMVAIGGAFGSVMRYLSSEFLTYFFRAQLFPVGTFFVNVFGSFLAGILYYFLIKYFNYFNLSHRSFLLAGFLGGFTTFSAFCLDFFRLFTSGNYNMAILYALMSVIFSILALFFGFYLMKFIA